MAKLSDAYKLLYPRVVCMITTVDKRGRINSAPADWLVPIEFDPPLVAMVIDDSHDTWKNVMETNEFTIGIPPLKLEKQVLTCAKPFPRGVNELEKAGLTWRAASKVNPPLINECPAALECRVREVIKKHCLIIGEVVAVHAPAKPFKPLMHLTGYKFSTIR
ncbi:MAG: flavin reductase family protein [Candidatus Aenigmatarchaeota archaeon]